MRKKGWEKRLKELDRAAMAFRVAEGAAGAVAGGEGWLRRTRQALDVPAAEVARRMGLVTGSIFRFEVAESRGVIEMGTLRRAAEALGCDLVYGLTPKDGTLTTMAEVLEAGRREKRAAAWALRLKKIRERRVDAAEKRWDEAGRKKQEEEWAEYWRLWSQELPIHERARIPRPGRVTPFYREQMRKGIKKALRGEGIRIR
jgi:transcriptional regulator with XRE-family HTH domain